MNQQHYLSKFVLVNGWAGRADCDLVTSWRFKSWLHLSTCWSLLGQDTEPKSLESLTWQQPPIDVRSQCKVSGPWRHLKINEPQVIQQKTGMPSINRICKNLSTQKIYSQFCMFLGWGGETKLFIICHCYISWVLTIQEMWRPILFSSTTTLFLHA